MEKSQSKKQDSAAREALLEQYGIICDSMSHLEMLVVATLLSYYALMRQQQTFSAFLSGESDSIEELNLFPFQLTSATLVLNSTSYFFKLSQDLSQHPQSDPRLRESGEINVLSSGLVLMAAALRAYDLFSLEFSPKATEVQAEQADLQEAENPF